MARLSRECIITEKIDGTNAQIFIHDSKVGTDDFSSAPAGIPWVWQNGQGLYIAAGSRNKWLTTEKNNDNYGFARWVSDNAGELTHLGHGRHFGEWWGGGIQRRYGLTEKRFSLFNVERWIYIKEDENDKRETLPMCCHVVPTLFRGEFKTYFIDSVLKALEAGGSQAAPGFMDPEGIVIWHTAARTMFKKTILDDEQPKSVVDKPKKTAIVSA